MLPALLNASEAIHHLRQVKNILAPDEAVEYLENRFNTYRLLALYQHFFPDEFANTTSPSYDNSVNFEDNHSPREIEFLYLVSENLFPISEYQLECAHEERLRQIPLIPMGCDWIEHEDIESLRSGWQILLPLSTEGRYWLELMAGKEWYEDELGVSWNEIVHPHEIDAALLKRLSSRAANPLKFIPKTLQLLNYESNNIWLDASAANELQNSFSWTIENINFLKSEWFDAKVILDQVYNLIEWLEQDLKNHFELVLAVWNTSSLRK